MKMYGYHNIVVDYAKFFRSSTFCYSAQDTTQYVIKYIPLFVATSFIAAKMLANVKETQAPQAICS